MSTYPCIVRDHRSMMNDHEFWDDVYPAPDPPRSWDDDDESSLESAEPCPECGAVGACMYDAEGRPLIRALSEEVSE